MLAGWPVRRIRLSGSDWLWRRSQCTIRCRFSTNSQSYQDNVDTLTARTRNIGIIAHIDAGKTTTTERMLYYSGHTRMLGNVDEGSTVTDFLPAERARGITIQSAAITLYWQQSKEAFGPVNSTSHTINLIDTPGHSDFTFEVIRSLRILDGAVCILDGVAGVEAQTEKVWFQADTYGIPRIIYVNKLDREGAAFGKSVRDIATKLQCWPAVCQIPWFENGRGRFQGVVDIISLRAYQWPIGTDGKTINSHELSDLPPTLQDEATKAREALVELLSEHDERMIEEWERCGGDFLSISPESIARSLRNCVNTPVSSVVPVFAGASFRNIGVQPLLDAIVSLLPNPSEVPVPQVKAAAFNGTLQELISHNASGQLANNKKANNASENVEGCALAFKVVNDARRGILVYVRVYHGSLKAGGLIYNTNLGVIERIPRLLKKLAADSEDVPSIAAGQIGVITGLKKARTGDTLVMYRGMSPKTGPPAPFANLELRPIDVPPPVFFASVEPFSLGEERGVRDALDILLREDPSLQLSVDEDSGQTHLSGMGELHLEIARGRLIQDFKAKAHIGKIEIGYRETVTSEATEQDSIFAKDVAGKSVKAGCTASVKAAEEDVRVNDTLADGHSIIRSDGNTIETRILHPNESDESWSGDQSRADIHRHLQNGARSALGRGPAYHFRMHGVHVTIEVDPTKHVFGKDTTPGAQSAAARLATVRALRASAAQSATTLVEPVMHVIVHTDQGSMGAVMQDILSARGGQVLATDAAADDAVSSGAHEREPIDVSRVYAPPDPYEVPSSGGDPVAGASFAGAASSWAQQRPIVARIPLREMVGYLKHLRSLTAGRGTFVMSFDRFEKMNSNTVQKVLKELRGV